MQTNRSRLIVTEKTRPRIGPHVHLRFDTLRQSWAVLAPEHVYWPDDISVAILKKLDGLKDVKSVIMELSKEYDAPADAVGPDVIEFLQTWADQRLIGDEKADAHSR